GPSKNVLGKQISSRRKFLVDRFYFFNSVP
ncbi:unnamed protein product, partial [marine sediment metagenome]